MSLAGRQNKNQKKIRYACKYGDVCWEHDYPHRVEYWHPAEEKNKKEYWAKYEAKKVEVNKGCAKTQAASLEAGIEPEPGMLGDQPPPPPPSLEDKKKSGPDGSAGILVEKDLGGVLVDVNAMGRQITDTRSSACFLSDLPMNFQGGEEALHFALGELYGQYGKIKKIELYNDKGMMDVDIFKGEALVVYHPSKMTGKMEKGDPVWDACSELDGKYRVLGYRHWRIRCEPAEWQKSGFDVKSRAKKFPCVQLDNLWTYSPSMPLSWFTEVQDAIRKHASEYMSNPFVKVEPSEGSATVWAKGAQEAIKFASVMQKSYFLGSKVVASLCRKEKPVSEKAPKMPIQKLLQAAGPSGMIELSMKLPEEKAAEEPAEGTQPDNAKRESRFSAAAPASEDVPMAQASTESLAEASGTFAQASMELEFRWSAGSKVQLRGLNSKPENNGKKAEVVKYLGDVGKYQLKMEDGRTVKVKPENVEAAQDVDMASTTASFEEDEAMEDEKSDNEDAQADATAAALVMAEGKAQHGAPILDPNIHGFQATVCVDPSLLPKREDEDKKDDDFKRRESSRSRERRIKERTDAIKAKVAASAAKGDRPKWLMPCPAELAAKAVATGGKPSSGDGGPPLPKEPEQSREELLKLSVAKLKALLKEFGKTARGCIEKSDFVDRLKPAPK